MADIQPKTQQAWDVYRKQTTGDLVWLDRVWFDRDMDAQTVTWRLISHDGYPGNIVVRKGASVGGPG